MGKVVYARILEQLDPYFTIPDLADSCMVLSAAFLPNILGAQRWIQGMDGLELSSSVPVY